jgi:hypothetical protein
MSAVCVAMSAQGLLAKSCCLTCTPLLCNPNFPCGYNTHTLSHTGSLKPEGLLSPRLAVPHPESAAKAAYLSFKSSGFLSQPQQPLLLAAQPPTTSSSPAGSPVGPQRLQAGSAAGSSAAAAASNSSSGGSSSGSSGASPWRVGLWHPWGSEGASSPGLPGQLVSQGLVAGGVAKYPGYIEVTLAAIPRPTGAVVVTDPAAGIRPALPAGYGTGFEIGESWGAQQQ